MSNVPMSKIFLGIAAVFFAFSVFCLNQPTVSAGASNVHMGALGLGYAIASGLALVASAIALRTD